MQEAFMKMMHGLKNIFLGILKLFFSLFYENKSETIKQINEEDVKKENAFSKSKNIQEEDDSEDSPRELYQEYINHKKYKITKKEFQKELEEIIEKLFEVKVKNLSKIQKEKLKKYSKEIQIKIQKEIENEKIKNREELKEALTNKIKKDYQEKEKKVSHAPENEIFKEKTSTLLNATPIEKLSLKKTQNTTSPTTFSKNPKSLINKTSYPTEKKTALNETYTKKLNNSKEEVQKFSNPVTHIKAIKEIVPKEPKTIKKNETVDNIKQDELEQMNSDLIISAVIEEQIERNENKEKAIEKNRERNETVSNNKKEEDKTANNLKNSNSEIKKQEIPSIIIPLEQIEKQNSQIIDLAQTEIQKEDFMEKEYEKIEKLLTDKINDLEDLLNKNLNVEQVNKIQKEINKLKNAKQKVSLHKEKDLEAIRIALESSITLEEKNRIKEKFKKLYESDEVIKHQDLINNIAFKSEEEIKKIEKLLIKESLRKTLKKLEVPLFISFPFIKNRFFRRFVSGLFVFRSFCFIKNILFNDPITYEPLDLSYLERGSDALNESIQITANNINLLEELKRITLLKYPELREDEEFLNYIMKIEIQLKKSHQKLLKQDKVVKKYFNKSKVLIRKRKKSI